MTPARFKSVMTPPPGGKFFYEINGERVEAPSWVEMYPKARELMIKNGVTGPVEWAVATYMCPFMPDWYCSGVSGRTVVRDKEAWANSEVYFRGDLVTHDIISSRLRICAKCKAHSREGVCLTCTGGLARILATFRGRRPKVLEDELSGVCTVARAYESVMASVECEPLTGESVPEGCWRNGNGTTEN